MRLEEIENGLLDDRTKGIPGGTAPIPLGEIGRRGWNVLREDLQLPVAVLKESALAHNSRWMQRFLETSGALIAPHGKTTMAPQLFRRQLDDGAWGITVATVHQLQICRRFGVQRVILANQLIGREAIRYLLDELQRDPEFDFYCLVDSREGVRLLADAARERAVGRPLQLLVEGGFRGGRTGARNLDGALEVARAVKRAEPYLTLHGVEGFEGLIPGATREELEARVNAFLDFLVDAALACEAEGLFADGPLLLTAGGSSFYDLVVKRFAAAGLERAVRVVTRSGCYLTHDSRIYRDAFHHLRERSPEVEALGPGLQPALEVWSYVQSRPEPERAILTMGKRDCSFDAGMPVPLAWYRAGTHPEPQRLDHGYEITALNDQHAFLRVPEDSPLGVGDLIASGISHPCTTFDRWQLLFVVNDAYDVVSAVRTFF
jgi:D-serine dehydratase